MKKLAVILMAVIACTTQTFAQKKSKIPVNQKIVAFFEKYSNNDKLTYVYDREEDEISYLLTSQRNRNKKYDKDVIKEFEKDLIKELEEILESENYFITSKVSSTEQKIITYSKDYSETEEVTIIYRIRGDDSSLTISYDVEK